MDPGKFAAKMQAYQSLQDPVLKDLVARIERGDVEATVALQQEIVNRELGDSKCVDWKVEGKVGWKKRFSSVRSLPRLDPFQPCCLPV
jgi:hypothetical protein